MATKQRTMLRPKRSVEDQTLVLIKFVNDAGRRTCHEAAYRQTHYQATRFLSLRVGPRRRDGRPHTKPPLFDDEDPAVHRRGWLWSL